MYRAPRGFLLPLSLSWAVGSACATGRPPLEPAVRPAFTARCAFLVEPTSGDPADAQSCSPGAFLDDEVELLVRGLEADPSWGALVSPELEAEGRTVVVANVAPSLEYFRRESAGEVADDVRKLVQGVKDGIVNRLFRRSLSLRRPDGSRVVVDFQEGQLRGLGNDYQEYLAQVSQRDGTADFFPTYEAVEMEGRAARTGLLWLVSGRQEPDGSVKVEFRIKTFEMARSADGQTLTIRGQLADRTGQLLRAVYTTWTEGLVWPSDPRSPIPPIRPSFESIAEASPEPEAESKPTGALPEIGIGSASPEPPPEEQAPAVAEASPARSPELKRDVEALPGPMAELGSGLGPSPVLWMTVARVRGGRAEPKTLSFDRSPLPQDGDRFALVFMNEEPELVAYMFGPTLPGRLAVRVTSDETDRSAVAPARGGRDVAVAMSSVYAHARRGPEYLLVLRRHQPWSLEEQGRAQWTCNARSTYRLGDVPATEHQGQVRVVSWVKNELEKLLGYEILNAPEAVETRRFLTLPLDRIPPGGTSDDALCIVLPFAPSQLEGDA